MNCATTNGGQPLLLAFSLSGFPLRPQRLSAFALNSSFVFCFSPSPFLPFPIPRLRHCSHVAPLGLWRGWRRFSINMPPLWG